MIWKIYQCDLFCKFTKTNNMKILNFVILAILTVINCSFNVNNSSEKVNLFTTCSIVCSYKPIVSNLSAVGFSNSIDEDNAVNVSTSTGYVAVIEHNNNEDLQVYVSILGTHPAGTVKFIREGVLIYSQYVSANTNFSRVQNYSNVLCTESFDVRWE